MNWATGQLSKNGRKKNFELVGGEKEWDTLLSHYEHENELGSYLTLHSSRFSAHVCWIISVNSPVSPQLKHEAKTAASTAHGSQPLLECAAPSKSSTFTNEPVDAAVRSGARSDCPAFGLACNNKSNRLQGTSNLGISIYMQLVIAVRWNLSRKMCFWLHWHTANKKYKTSLKKEVELGVLPHVSDACMSCEQFSQRVIPPSRFSDSCCFQMK